MKKRWYYVALLCICSLWYGCTQPTQTADIHIPPHIVPLKKMAAIQADVLLINQYIKSLPMADNIHTNDSIALYYHRLFEKYNISQPTYDSSLSFYQNNIPLLNSVYQQSIEILNTLSYEAENQKQSP